MKLKMKIYDIVLVIFILLFIAAGSVIYKDYKKMYDAKKVYDEIKEQCVSDKNKTAENNEKNINWDKLYKINSDITAWIEIPGTVIDYPVVRTQDYDFYLSHDIRKKYSKFGTLFIDQRLYKKPFKSKNLVIYGHNMGRYTDIMFSSLMQYEKQIYCNKHKYIHLYRKEEMQTYKIISVREVSSSSDAYKIKLRKGEYLKWIDNAVRKSENLADNDKVNKETQPEKVLTLSTCTYGKNRLVLHCILIK